MRSVFHNRQDAGVRLAEKLIQYRQDPLAIVLSIPRGGVVVGAACVQFLKIAHDVLIVRKIGAPGNPELAIGAVAENDTKYIDWNLALRLDIKQEYLNETIKQKKKEVVERSKAFHKTLLEEILKNKKTVIITDDGVATGATIKAAVIYIKNLSKSLPKDFKIILAFPVIAREIYCLLKKDVAEIIALLIADEFGAVGQFYLEFPQVSDEEVVKLLKTRS